MSRQVPTHILIHNCKTGSTRGQTVLEATQRSDGAIDLALSEGAHEVLESGFEVKLMSDRGTCWHEFRN